MIKIKFDTSEIEAELDRFVEKINNDVLTVGAAAAAKVFYDEAKLRAPVLETDKGGSWFYGTNQRYWFPVGNLRDSIYRTLSEDNSGNGYVTYHIGWNHSKAPYGFMVEFGTSRAAPHPFLRPAYEAVKGVASGAAIKAMRDKLNAG